MHRHVVLRTLSLPHICLIPQSVWNPQKCVIEKRLRHRHMVPQSNWSISPNLHLLDFGTPKNRILILPLAVCSSMNIYMPGGWIFLRSMFWTGRDCPYRYCSFTAINGLNIFLKLLPIRVTGKKWWANLNNWLYQWTARSRRIFFSAEWVPCGARSAHSSHPLRFWTA